jgi:hypothetical protein
VENLAINSIPTRLKKSLERFKMGWRRMEKISWTESVRNEDVLHRVKEESKVTRTIKRWKTSWIGHILRMNCLLKHVTEGRRERGD